ncbi:MAG: hypothetical protein FWG00_01420 [Coriobacteriia bacterium]|nr:hypothetical protein [Coriobacteriia bacterium]MDR2714743.1 hypothetical protein [Coriobacteriales bacterium]
MPALQVRDFPEELYEELRLCAQREYRSMAQQTIVAVKDYVSRETERREALLRKSEDVERAERMRRTKEIFDRIDARPPFIVPEGFPTPEQMIREDRDSR